MSVEDVTITKAFICIISVGTTFKMLPFSPSLLPPHRSHATGMDNKAFWRVYYEHLEMVAGLAGRTKLAGLMNYAAL